MSEVRGVEDDGDPAALAEARNAGRSGADACNPYTSNPRVPFQLSSERPTLVAPEGCPIIVHVVVNLEYWPFDQPVPRMIVTPPHGRAHVPDIPNFGWSEYGNRCGMPRLLKLFGDRSIPVSASINASVLEAYPTLAVECLEAGWEFVGHGSSQHSMAAIADEAEAIHSALDQLEAFTGRRPRGWMSPGWSETFETPDILRREGVRYLFEWVIDDLPAWMRTRHGPLIAMPYGLDLNDSVIFAIEKHSTKEYCKRVLDTVNAFARETADTGQPRILTLPIHPHLIAVPHRIGMFTDVVDELLSRQDTVFMVGQSIAEWFESQDGNVEQAL